MEIKSFSLCIGILKKNGVYCNFKYFDFGLSVNLLKNGAKLFKIIYINTLINKI